MASITSVAKEFFEACEAGKEWDGCKAFCTPNARFSSQAGAVGELRSLQ
jgi:hypothetical protein